MGYMTLLERFRIPTYNDPNETIRGRVDFDLARCTGCGMCVKICPASALELVDKKATMKEPPDDQCMFCGDCQAVCPVDAVIMKRPYRWTSFYKVIEHGEPKPPRLFTD